MPMMDELLAKLKASPPETADELEAVLDETGYELLPKEPGTDVPGEAEEVGEEEEEAPEGEGEAEEAAEDGMDMFREMAGAPRIWVVVVCPLA